MKKVIISLLMVMLGMSIYGGSVFAAEKWAMGCSGAGSGPYNYGAAITNVLNKHQSAIRFSAQATAGYNENVELVSAGTMEIAMQQLAGLLDAYGGRMAFKGHPHKRLRLMFPMAMAVYHVVTREAANIKTIYDLKGKKMNISLPAQTTRTMTETFLKCANINLTEIKAFEMATGQTFKALQDGVIDATGNAYSAPHGRLLELATNTRIRILNIPDEVIDRFVEIRGISPNYTIPSNTYPGQAEPVKTFAVFDVFFARDDQPEDQVYIVTKAFWDNLNELKKIPGLKDLKMEYAYSEKSKVPYHPGSLRYYKEIGLLK